MCIYVSKRMLIVENLEKFSPGILSEVITNILLYIFPVCLKKCTHFLFYKIDVKICIYLIGFYYLLFLSTYIFYILLFLKILFGNMILKLNQVNIPQFSKIPFLFIVTSSRIPLNINLWIHLISLG